MDLPRKKCTGLSVVGDIRFLSYHPFIYFPSFPAWPDPMVYFRLVTTTLSTCWSVFKDAPLSAWVQSDVLQVLIQGVLQDALRDVLQFVLLKESYSSCHLYAAILFTFRKQSVKIFCKLLIVVKYFLKILPQPKK